MGTNASIITYLMANAENFVKNMTEAESKTDGFKKKIATMSAVAGGVAVAGIAALTGAVVAGVKSTVEWGNTLDSIGDVLGTTTDESAGLAYMFETIGGDADQLTQALAVMAKGLETGPGKAGPAGKAIEALGIDYRDAVGQIKPAAVLFQEVSDKLGPMKDGLDKTDIMMTIFGKSGKEMGDALAAAAGGGLEDFTIKAENAGLAFTPEQTQNVIEFGKSQKELDLMWKGLSATVGMQLMPALSSFVKILQEKLGDGELHAKIWRLSLILSEFAEKSTPKLLDLVDGVLQLIDSLSKMPESTWKGIGAFAALLIIINPLIKVFTFLAGIVTTIGGLFGATGTAASMLGAVFVFLFTNPIGWLILAIGALIVAIVFLGRDALETCKNIWGIAIVYLVKAYWWLKDTFISVWGGIGEAIKGVIGWVLQFAQTLLGIKLPDWLQPGSPTPFEMGLRGISKELQALSGMTMPGFYSGLELPPGGGSINKAGAMIIINNPVGETASNSISRTLQNLSYLGIEV